MDPLTVSAEPLRAIGTLEEPASASLRVALLGLGTVGKHVASRLIDPEWRKAVMAQGITAPILACVGVRNPGRPRGLELPSGLTPTDDLSGLVSDPGIDVVVEVIGGTGEAASLVRRAIDAGKHVVTANKALLAEHGSSLESAARRAGVSLRFESAVAGGVPVLGPIVHDLAANRIHAVRGIVNGTTNHILSAMARDGREYKDVLAESQERGYAEADPTADVEGLDAAHKLAILTRLAFGTWPSVGSIGRSVPTTGADAPAGITGVRREDLAGAARLGLTIKLVARVERDQRGSLRAAVTPMAVRMSSPLGATDGVTNLVEIVGDPVGRVSFRGTGAGGPATASAVLGDLLALARGEGSTWDPLPPAYEAAVTQDLGHDHAWMFVADGLAGGDVPPTILDIALASDAGAFVTRAMPIASLRERLAGTAVEATIYPVLAES